MNWLSTLLQIADEREVFSYLQVSIFFVFFFASGYKFHAKRIKISVERETCCLSYLVYIKKILSRGEARMKFPPPFSRFVTRLQCDLGTRPKTCVYGIRGLGNGWVRLGSRFVFYLCQIKYWKAILKPSFLTLWCRKI